MVRSCLIVVFDGFERHHHKKFETEFLCGLVSVVWVSEYMLAEGGRFASVALFTIILSIWDSMFPVLYVTLRYVGKLHPRPRSL